MIALSWGGNGLQECPWGVGVSQLGQGDGSCVWLELSDLIISFISLSIKADKSPLQFKSPCP